ncbi:flagellar motor switch protein FliN [Jonesia quinghaiensis]|uniref:flagellar motor switch protein FliN n=1 Tax=Jonesia quinghaiensis TaxID=262806 RepID=UPI0003FA568F|nr:flagellar motor switch protein FliN [Jonesia quinghaiensis]
MVTLATFQDSANALVEFIPHATPLRAALSPTPPVGDAIAGMESFGFQLVGSTQYAFGLYLGPTVFEALAQAEEPIDARLAVRPALEAASVHFGQGIVADLDAAPSVTQGAAPISFALTTGAQVVGWLTIHNREDMTLSNSTPDQPSEQTSAPAATAPAAPATTPSPAEPAIRPFSPPVMSTGNSGEDKLRLLYDVEMTLTVEIGRAKLPVKQVLDLTPGSVVELDRAAGSPADLLVNGHLVARGEVVVVDEDYGLRITEIIDTSEVFA